MDYATALAAVLRASQDCGVPVSYNQAKKLAKMKIDQERRATHLSKMLGIETHKQPSYARRLAVAAADPTGDFAASRVDGQRAGKQNNENARRRIATRGN